MRQKKSVYLVITTFCIMIGVLVYFLVLDSTEYKENELQNKISYPENIFNKNEIIKLDIDIDESHFTEMIQKPSEKTYYKCNISINGETFYDIGIRTKGNSSLKSLDEKDSEGRYSFKLEFDHYDPTATCYGLDKMSLNNVIFDATYMKEYMSYEILSQAGVNTPLYSYAEISVNGEKKGLYLAVENIEESFIERCYGDTKGMLYKPDYTKEGSFYDGTDLAYKDDNAESYSTIFNTAVFKNPTNEDYNKVIKALKHLDSSENIEDYIEVTEVIKYIAANIFLMNDDSYFGYQPHNYYLYERDGKLTMLPWDYNLAFGGFLLIEENDDATKIINRPIDSVTPLNSWEKRPMIKRILKVEKYKEKYYEQLLDIIENYFQSGEYIKTIEQVEKLIDSSVENDNTAFYEYKQFKDSLKHLKLLGTLRAESIKKQINGELTTTYKDRSNSEALVDGSEVDIIIMGTR